jgi:hypothetical protein
MTTQQPPAHDAPSTARDYFDSEVYPLLTRRCAGCHDVSLGPPLGFYDSVAASAYDVLIASGIAGDFTPTALIITEVDMSSHPAGGYLPDELTIVESWLQQEHAERNP